MPPSDLASAIEQSHAALGAILKGDPSVYQALYSPADDVTLGEPVWTVRTWSTEGGTDTCWRRLALPRRRSRRGRTHSEVRLRNSRLHRRGGARPSQGRGC